MRRLARTVAAWWWPSMLLVGLPIGLLHAPERPTIPHHLPTHYQLANLATEPLTRATAITGFILLGWLLWAAVTCAALAAIYQRLLWWCRWLPRMRLPGPLQSLSAAVLGTIAVSGAGTAVSAAPPAAHIGLTHTDPVQHPPASPTTPSTPGTASTRTATPTPPTATPLSPAAAAAGGSSQPLTYTVHRGDTLWRIAQRQLDDPARWPQIYHLNQSRYDHHGQMKHGDHIEPGWILTMPQNVTPPHSAPAPPPSQPPIATPPSPVTSSPATAAAAPDTTPPAPSHLHAPAATATPQHSSTHHSGIHLPNGNWVTVALAASLTAAASMVWLQRRRRYTPRPLTEPVDDDPDLKPLPPAITQLRRGLRHQAPDLLPRSSDQLADSAVLHDGTAEPLPPIGPSGPQLSGLPDPLPATGLGLTGDGALAAARALLVATLSAGSLDDPDARGHLITTADTLTQLLGAHADQIRPVPRLTVTDDLTDALTHVDDLLIERRRLLEDHDADDLDGLRDKDPYYPPMPPVLLLTPPPPPHLTTRLSNALRLGDPLQISAAVLGLWPAGDTLTIDHHGRLSTGDAARLAVLDTPTAVQLLTVLFEAHTGQPHDTDNEPVSKPATAKQAAPADGSPATSPAPALDHLDPPEIPTSPTVTQHQARVRIRLLGEPAILNHHNQPVAGLRLHARELLVYLAIHRDGADIPDIMEAFWPTATRRRAAQRLSTETANLRRCIRDAATDRNIKPVINTGGRYHLNPQLLDIDIWRMADALAHATTATQPKDQAAALREAITTHTGTIAEGYEYDWIDQHRYHLTHQGIQARLQLAKLLAPTQPHTAADLAQAAADLDPLDEQAAQHAIRALSAIGDTAGIQARLDQLRNALNDIDEQPSTETLTLAAELQHTQPSADSPPPTPNTPAPTSRHDGPRPIEPDAQEGGPQ